MYAAVLLQIRHYFHAISIQRNEQPKEGTSLKICKNGELFFLGNQKKSPLMQLWYQASSVDVDSQQGAWENLPFLFE